MSILFKSPMPGKFQAFFFCWTVVVMALFASVGISIAHFNWTLAFTLLFADVLMVGFGFMIRKRVLKSIGIDKPQR